MELAQSKNAFGKKLEMARPRFPRIFRRCEQGSLFGAPYCINLNVDIWWYRFSYRMENDYDISPYRFIVPLLIGTLPRIVGREEIGPKSAWLSCGVYPALLAVLHAILSSDTFSRQFFRPRPILEVLPSFGVHAPFWRSPICSYTYLYFSTESCSSRMSLQGFHIFLTKAIV